MGYRYIPELWNRSELEMLIHQCGSVHATARHLNCSRCAVRNAVYTFGIVTPYSPSGRKHPSGTIKRAVELYRTGLSARAVAERLGGTISPAAVRYHVLRLGIARDRAIGLASINNATASVAGRKRLALIRRATELHCYERMGYTRISRSLGIGHTTVVNYLKTPYAQALREYVFGSPLQNETFHARAMIRQGCDTPLIARTLGIRERRVEDLRGQV